MSIVIALDGMHPSAVHGMSTAVVQDNVLGVDLYNTCVKHVCAGSVVYVYCCLTVLSHHRGCFWRHLEYRLNVLPCSGWRYIKGRCGFVVTAPIIDQFDRGHSKGCS